jgi:putative molybdopterin biosynthesis protein
MRRRNLSIMSEDAHLEVGLACGWRIGAGSAPPEEAQLLALLDGITRTGSIAAAAREQGLSYRSAWGRIEKWQVILGQSLLDATRGSGSRLSAFAERLLDIDRRLHRRLAPQLAVARDEMRRALMASPAHTATVRLSIVASHDLALVRLRELLETSGHEVDVQFRGSVESLATLARGGCDVAGFHCPEGEIGRRIWPEYRRLLKPRKHALFRLCRRTQGLIVQKGNPKRVRGVADLARKGVRFLNRQPGAGTRLLLDLLLRKDGVDPSQIRGYASEEYTHAAVAALVAGGEADAALGIEAAARRFGLDFVSLVAEDYFLVMRRDRLRDAPLVVLKSHLVSAAFRNAIKSFGGYDARHAGEEVPIRDPAPPARRQGAAKARDATAGPNAVGRRNGA